MDKPTSLAKTDAPLGRTLQHAAKPAAVFPLHLPVHRILVPVDFSANSIGALSYALGIAQQVGAEVILAHVFEPLVTPIEGIPPLVMWQDPTFDGEGSFLEQMKALTEGIDVKTRHLVRQGRAWREIVKIAAEVASDLIVIATHGHTGLRHALIGSVAEKVVRHAPCPVLVFRVGDDVKEKSQR